MSFANPFASGAQPPRKPNSNGRNNSTSLGSKRKISPLTITLVAIVLIIFFSAIFAEVWTKYLWFEHLGFESFFLKRWFTQGILFLLGVISIALPVYFALSYAYKKRPEFIPLTREQQAEYEFRKAIEPLRKIITILAPIVLGIFAGLTLAQNWQAVLLLINQQPFGESDPIFNKDISFYVFTLPVINIVLALANFMVLVTAIASVGAHFLYGGIKWGQNNRVDLTTSARVQIGIVAAFFTLILAAQHWFSRYSLLTSTHEKFDGAAYTDVNALIPSKTILAISALIVAALLVVWIFKNNIRLPIIGAGLLILSSLVVGSAYPYLIQTFQVDPNERQLENEYINYNIQATLKAYGLADYEEISYQAQSDAEPGQLRADAATTAQIRLLDPSVVSPTFGQREANRRYWGFEETLSVDRYEIDGVKQDTVIGVRELRPDKLNLSNQSWVNQHVIYTHGFGVAAAYGNRRQADGEPTFYQSGVPGNGALGEFEERVYFGRHSPNYSIVGAPADAEPQEFDYQSGTAGDDQGRQVSNTYQGDGGPKIGNYFNRILYAIKFREPNILISSYVNEQSQILYDRNPQQRVLEVAPFLSLDSEMYPAVVDGRLKWVIDAYTTTNQYPYSKQTDFNLAVADSRRPGIQSSILRDSNINYLRNSVKATVDAFDGKVTLYAWDTDDPILKAWEQTFPESLTGIDEISSELMSHLRYPSDLFKVQRSILGKYHVTDAEEFYVGQDFWQTTPDPTQSTSESSQASLQSPHYLTLQMPGDDSPRFSLSSSYIPESGQDVLTGFLAVDSETGAEAGKPAASYGRLTLLVLPSSSPVSAPRQVQNTFNSNPQVSQELNLLRAGNSEVINGNLLTLPVGGGLLYVQPVYVMSSSAGGGTSYPLLRKVLVSFGDKVGYADTLDEALDAVFGGDSGASAGDASLPSTGSAAAIDDSTLSENPEPESQDATEVRPEEAPLPDSISDPDSELNAALIELEQAWNDADEALRNGDWTAYGQAQQRIERAIERAKAANAQQ